MRFKQALGRFCAAALVAAAIAGFPAAQAQNGFQQGLDAYMKGEYRKALELWQPGAEAGDAVAAFNIGVLYAQGLGVEVDPQEALRWYRQSALAGYANAQFNLGVMYYNGTGTQKNIGQTVAWWEKAAEQEHPEAMYNLGTFYRDGKGVEQNTRRAIRLFEKGVAVGDARAASALAALREQAPAEDERIGTTAAGETPPPEASDRDGWPHGENPAHWSVQVFAAAKEGAARRFVAEHDLEGLVRIYRTEADGKTWYKGLSGSYADQAAAKAALERLAQRLPGTTPWLRRYRDIQAEAVAALPAGAPARETEPVRAEAGQEQPPPAGEAPEAAGEAAQQAGSDDEPETATQTSSTASAQPSDEQEDARPEPEPRAADEPESTNPRGALRRGQLAFNAQDYEEAFAVWQPLAEQGMPDAQYGIGFMYESGWGVKQDYTQAHRWYQLAAQQGHVKSQFNLGMLYQNGNGVAQNEALGLYWIQTAADQGDERALTYLKSLN